MPEESVGGVHHGKQLEQKRVSEVRWNGSEMEIDDASLLTEQLGEAAPNWLVKAAETGALKCGRVGWFELREGGGLVFQEAGRYV